MGFAFFENTYMAILKFRAYFEEDDSVYRDVAIRHTQSFFDLHEAILKGYEFDAKHDATFYRSNDNWQEVINIFQGFGAYDEVICLLPHFLK